MIRHFFLMGFLLIATFIQAQSPDSKSNKYQNSADFLMASDGNLTIGGYCEVHFNQPLNQDVRMNGTLDVHRIVMLLGYKFNSRTQFVTEIEFEHVSEVYIEQAFLQYKLNDYISFKSGLLLIPMGLINEYHEPTTFNGVERPVIDNVISPTTWREIGFGFSGNVFPVSISYQAYLVNGFMGYNGKALLNGKNGFRSGRQKGAESVISSPNFAGKIEYYGIRGLNVGISGYFGDTQSTLYNGIAKNDKTSLAKADSSVVGIRMIGFDSRYSNGGLQLRGQYYLNNISNTGQYNHFTAVNGKINDLGKSMSGFYVEAGYNVFYTFEKITSELIPFIRLEGYNTHRKTESLINKNLNYRQSVVTTGLSWKITNNSVLKMDIKFQKPEGAEKFSKVFNAGFGVMF